MNEQEANKSIEGWMIVEIFGHQRYVGYVSKETLGMAVMFRVDVPELPEREYTLKRGQYDEESRYMPPGTKVKAGKVQGYTKLFGVGAVYALTPVTQEAAMKALEEMQPQPLTAVGVAAEPKALEAGSIHDPLSIDYEDEDEDDGDDDDEENSL